jgi:hypothetical protein
MFPVDKRQFEGWIEQRESEPLRARQREKSCLCGVAHANQIAGKRQFEGGTRQRESEPTFAPACSKIPNKAIAQTHQIALRQFEGLDPVN